MQFNPYLCFEGRTEEAIEFYKAALGAEVEFMMRGSDMPADAGPAEGAPEGCGAPSPSAIVHAQVKIGGASVMMSDGMNSGKAEFKGVTLSLTMENDEQVKERFAAISEGGVVHVAPAPTFFASLWGVCSDKFGVNWMVLCPAPVHAQA